MLLRSDGAQPYLWLWSIDRGADWEAQLPPDKQREVQEWRQYDAARPTVDPNDAAQDYLKGQAGEDHR